ncbi:hypothetical protein AURDEDRAFT_173784 [Auricularia subglabra TFB-10046 SS5]|nr:hypothetical protein AURDEDRAFT_173784 [Auricularia subglabra TFB-10046 SS5]
MLLVGSNTQGHARLVTVAIGRQGFGLAHAEYTPPPHLRPHKQRERGFAPIWPRPSRQRRPRAQVRILQPPHPRRKATTLRDLFPVSSASQTVRSRLCAVQVTLAFSLHRRRHMPAPRASPPARAGGYAAALFARAMRGMDVLSAVAVRAPRRSLSQLPDPVGLQPAAFPAMQPARMGTAHRVRIDSVSQLTGGVLLALPVPPMARRIIFSPQTRRWGVSQRSRG